MSKIFNLAPILLFICSSCFQANADNNDDDYIAKITGEHLDSLAKADKFSGVVMIAKHSKVIFSKAYGFRILSDSIPNNINTKFNLASIGKMFTGLVIMQLVQSGKLSLSDKVGKYLPDYPNDTVKNFVTIHQLLTHTAGTGNYWSDRIEKTKNSTLEEQIQLIAKTPMQFFPGTNLSYSNNGFIILGFIIEKISGKSYFDYVKENIFIPADMNNTDFYELDYPVPNLAIGYYRPEDRPLTWLSNVNLMGNKGTSAGGVYSTAEDLLKFVNYLFANKFLTPENTKFVTSAQENFSMSPYGKFGYGFIENYVNQVRQTGHSGGHPGISNEVLIFPDLGYVVIILSNRDEVSFRDVYYFLRGLITGNNEDAEHYYFTRNAIDILQKKGLGDAQNFVSSYTAQGTPNGKIFKAGITERLAIELLWENKTNTAIDLLKLCIFARPEFPSPYYTLAEIYRKKNNISLAKEYYDKYLALEPDDSETSEKLKQLINQTNK